MGTTPEVLLEDGYREGDDYGLVLAARADPRDFAALYRQYSAPVYGYLRSRAGSDEDAADLTQQVFLQALRGLGGYDARKASFAAWLFRIARNVATDAYRRRRGAVSWELLPEALRGAVGDDNAEDAALRRESLARVRDVLAGLSPEKRELIWLRFVAELEVREIAAVISKSPAAVRKGIERALRELEEEYHER